MLRHTSAAAAVLTTIAKVVSYPPVLTELRRVVTRQSAGHSTPMVYASRAPRISMPTLALLGWSAISTSTAEREGTGNGDSSSPEGDLAACVVPPVDIVGTPLADGAAPGPRLNVRTAVRAAMQACWLVTALACRGEYPDSRTTPRVVFRSNICLLEDLSSEHGCRYSTLLTKSFERTGYRQEKKATYDVHSTYYRYFSSVATISRMRRMTTLPVLSPDHSVSPSGEKAT